MGWVLPAHEAGAQDDSALHLGRAARVHRCGVVAGDRLVETAVPPTRSPRVGCVLCPSLLQQYGVVVLSRLGATVCPECARWHPEFDLTALRFFHHIYADPP